MSLKPRLRLQLRLLLLIALLLLIGKHQITIAQNQQKIDSLVYLFETARHDSAKVRFLVFLAREYENIDLPKALEYSEKAIELAEKKPNLNNLDFALFNMGIISLRLGLHEISANYFYKYLQIQKDKGNKQGIAYALTNLGALYLQIKQFEKSIENHKEALQMFRELKEENPDFRPETQIITIYNNLGVAAQNLNQTREAIDYYSRGISMARLTEGQQSNLSNLLNNLGSLYIRTGMKTEGLLTIQEALDIRLKTNNVLGQANSFRELGRYYMNEGEHNKAISFFKKGYALTEKSGGLANNAGLVKFIYDTYKAMNQTDSALRYHELYFEYNNRLHAESSLRELSKLELSLQFKEKEKKLEFEKKRRDLYFTIAGLCLISTIIVLGLLYFLSLSREKRLRLEKENISLASENMAKELEYRNKELTTNVLYQIRKNDLIADIVSKLKEHQIPGKDISEETIRNLLSELEETQENSVWNEFEVRFQQVHNDFYTKLTIINPELTTNDRRLCAFLKLNMSTKEISAITGQSVRSIEVARTRLRKKLNLTNSETGLTEFLSQL